MAHPVPPQRTLSVADYLALEAESSVRHEYVDGQIYAMTGATRTHNRLVARLARLLDAACDGTDCRTHVESMRLQVAPRVFYYPDAMVVCGPEGADPLVEDAPSLLVEVLSPSSLVTDRVEKMTRYLALPSLAAYLIVHQEYRGVEVNVRDAGGAWTRSVLHDAGAIPLRVPPGAVLSLEALYADLAVPTVAEARAAGAPIFD